MNDSVITYDGSDGKFQRGTSTLRPTGTGIWLAVGGVGMVVGEAAFQATWGWSLAAAVLASAVAVVAWRSRSRSARALSFGLSLLALTLLVAGWRSWRAGASTERVAVAAAVRATEDRDRLLASAAAGALQLARNALQRTASSAAGSAPDLRDLLGNGPLEQGLVVIGGDSVIALAGPQRTPSVDPQSPATLIRLPFAHLLVVSLEGTGGRRAQVSLLLDADRALPTSEPSLGEAASGWSNVTWRWQPTAAITPHRTLDGALSRVSELMTSVPPDRATLVERAAMLSRWLSVLALVVLALVVLLSGAPPVARGLALLMPVWVLHRAGVAAEALGPIAMPALLSAATLLMIAVVLWRRPARRTPIGMLAAVILLLLGPPLVAMAGWRMAPPVEAGGLLAWFGWQVVLALATAAYLAVASAPLRTRGDDSASWHVGAIAIGLSLAVGLLGINAWQPGAVATVLPTGWDGTWYWYLPAWFVALGAMLPVTSPRIRRVAVVTAASVLAALSAWGASLDARMQLADADLARLAAKGDSTTLSRLDMLGSSIASAGVQNLDSLYGIWRGSDLAAAEVPSQLAIWSDTTVISWVALDSMAPEWGDLTEIVGLPDTGIRTVALARGAGEHHVLVVPVGGDTSVSVLVGPRSRLVLPTRFGKLTGWRNPAAPAYRLDRLPGSVLRPDATFRRSGRNIRSDRLVDAGEAPMVIRATVSIPPPQPFAVRAALTVLLDALLILALWWIVERVLGFRQVGDPAVFRRSYRRTIAAALISFFVVPAALFTFWSALRLRQDVSRQRSDDVTRALEAIAADQDLDSAALEDPQTENLTFVADSAGAEVSVYYRSRLVASSAPLLASLGIISPVVDPAMAAQTVGEGGITTVAGNTVRFGVNATPVNGTVVAATLPGADAEISRGQIDLALLLLLTSLGATLAAVGVAGAVARALGRPIEALRRRALAIGRRESVPPLDDAMAEFEPVFGAITQMEHDLRESEALLENETARTARVVAWGEMARQVAHEIKNPLTPMRLGLQHLGRLAADGRPDLPEQMAATTDKLLAEIDRLDRIARSFARYGTPPERNKGPLEPVDLGAVTREIAELFSVPGATPIVEVIGQAPVPVATRHEELIQVLLNLLDNARQAGSNKVTLQLSDGCLVVCDDGAGIPEDQLERIFEPTFSTTTSGTGLGLAIVRRLVEGWGGSVDAVSSPGRGTEFTIRFSP